ncbi:SAM-dependent methyltransferase [Mycolicibacterium litorale]|nr:SAM-dependent methyltransferase [Mycolicibacterium litorale]
MDSLVSNVSDTARWVATYRATESARGDALFHDPLAERLAGDRGRAIVAAAPRRVRDGWWLVARTRVIDDLIGRAIADGCDRVLNLAAGLDTRPYRLDLPSELIWVEADLPGLVAEKDRALADQTPRCRLSRHAVDLSDALARDAFLAAALDGANRAFVLTEGLLMYLEDTDVASLSGALHRSGIAWWTFDFASPGLRTTMNTKAAGLLQNAPFKFCPADGLAFFEKLGWATVAVESVLAAAYRFDRLSPLMRLMARLPQPDPRRPGNRPWSAVACMVPDAG